MPALYLDESEQGAFLGVGGFYADLSHVSQMEAAWRQMKVNDLGLDADDELKWNLPEGHPTRRKLDASGRGGRQRNEAMIDTLTSLPLTFVCAVMRDTRSPGWQRITGPRSARDFYCEGLRYVLQRFGEEAHTRAGNEPCLCVVDRPEGLTRINLPWSSTRWLEHGLKAAHEMYRNVMGQGPGRGPQGEVRPLRQARFASGLLVGHASHDDFLQMADCVSGAVTSLVKDSADGPASDWLVGLVRAMVPRFRGGRAEMFGNGLVVWPMDPDLWNSLRRRLL
jgi:hypothetical protein